jgi:hypothetical protein
LLKYQCGKELAEKIRGKIDANDVYLWQNNFSSSFNFYTSTLRKEFSDSVLANRQKVWVMYDKNYREEILKSGYIINDAFEAADYEITKADIRFLNPAIRDKVLSKSFIAEISRGQ